MIESIEQLVKGFTYVGTPKSVIARVSVQEEASQSDQKAGLSNGRVFRENGKATGGLLSAEPSEWVPVKHEAATVRIAVI